MPSEKAQAVLAKYIQYYETLTRRSIRLIEKVAEPGMVFKNPFYDIAGLEEFEELLGRLFARTENQKFKVRDYSWGENGEGEEGGGEVAYLRWSFSCDYKGKRRYIEGMSEILFSRRGLVLSHADHWDAAGQVYEHVPLLGALLRWIKGKLKA